jgi:hypothetical protein
MLERLTGLGLGVGLMYFFDPRVGRRRRALVRDRCIHSVHEIETAVDLVWHDLSTRASRLTAEAKAMCSDDYAPDDVIEARVRSALGRVVSHPRALHVNVRAGRAVLSGPILADEVENLLETVNTVRGVLEVENQLEVHQQAEGLPALQGGSTRHGGHRGTVVEENQGSPTSKVLIGLAGGWLMARAIKRNHLTSLVAGVLCVGLSARGLTKASATETQSRHRGERGGLPFETPTTTSGTTGSPGMMVTRVAP